MIVADVHNHTNASHGKASVGEMYAAAKDRGLAVYGFSEHSPRPEAYSYPVEYREHLRQNFVCYASEVMQLRALSGSPKVLLGMELDWFPSERPFMEAAVAAYPFDFIIGGIHFLGRAHGNANRAVRLLGQRDADLYALNLARKRCNRVQIVHIRADAVDILPPEHRDRDRAALVKLHRVEYDALHLEARTRLGLEQRAVDLAAVDLQQRVPGPDTRLCRRAPPLPHANARSYSRT